MIAHSLLVLTQRSNALAEMPSRPAKDAILAGLGEVIAEVERGDDPFTTPRP
jgi:hypothetical protein